jgi:hypothetical protein
VLFCVTCDALPAFSRRYRVPFRPIDIEVAYGEPQPLVTAAAGEVELQISCTTFGASGVAGGPNYVVGVKDDDGQVRGKYVTQNEYSTDLSEGDELWVAAAEELQFTSVIRITGLVRSEPGDDSKPKRSKSGKSEPDSDSAGG